MDRLYFNPNYDYNNGGLRLRMGMQKSLRDFQSNYPFSTLGENLQLELNNRYVFGSKFYTVVGLLFQNQKADYEGGQIQNQTDVFANIVALVSQQFRINMGSRLGHLRHHAAHHPTFDQKLLLLQPRQRGFPRTFQDVPRRIAGD